MVVLACKDITVAQTATGRRTLLRCRILESNARKTFSFQFYAISHGSWNPKFRIQCKDRNRHLNDIVKLDGCRTDNGIPANFNGKLNAGTKTYASEASRVSSLAATLRLHKPGVKRIEEYLVGRPRRVPVVMEAVKEHLKTQAEAVAEWMQTPENVPLQLDMKGSKVFWNLLI